MSGDGCFSQVMALGKEIRDKLESLVGTGNLLPRFEDTISCSFDNTAAVKQLPECMMFATNIVNSSITEKTVRTAILSV